MWRIYHISNKCRDKKNNRILRKNNTDHRQSNHHPPRKPEYCTHHQYKKNKRSNHGQIVLQKTRTPTETKSETIGMQ